MKARKFLWLLPLLVVLLTGCSVKPLSDDLRTNVERVLASPSTLYNQTSLGYKYYLPMGFTLIFDDRNNQTIYHNRNHLFMYVDVISYFHRYQGDFQNSKLGNYFSMELDHNGIKGYIEITKYGNRYYVDMVYNYARIEAYVARADLERIVLNGIRILSSITFNDAVIMEIMGNNQNLDIEEIFNLYQPPNRAGSFLEYIETFDRYADEDLPDQDEIRVNTRQE